MMKKAFNRGVWGEDARHHGNSPFYRPDVQPDNLPGGLIYQVFPDRFYNSKTPKNQVFNDRILRFDEWGALPQWEEIANAPCCNDYFGGDLEGIRLKLDYLRELGVTALYLNPIFEAHSNHSLQNSDYTRIDPLLGNENDFANLCRDAAKHGISVILDGVFSHTGSDSVYFNRQGRYNGGAWRDPESPYRSWYRLTTPR
jgi:glycosidase